MATNTGFSLPFRSPDWYPGVMKKKFSKGAVGLHVSTRFVEQLEELKERWGLSQSETIRRAIRLSFMFDDSTKTLQSLRKKHHG
jgi:hypothetical protein